MPDELWTEVCDIVQETGIKTIPKCKPMAVSFQCMTKFTTIKKIIKKMTSKKKKKEMQKSKMTV